MLLQRIPRIFDWKRDALQNVCRKNSCMFLRLRQMLLQLRHLDSENLLGKVDKCRKMAQITALRHCGWDGGLQSAAGIKHRMVGPGHRSKTSCRVLQSDSQTHVWCSVARFGAGGAAGWEDGRSHSHRGQIPAGARAEPMVAAPL